jgi:hypothetical protein
LSGYPRWLCVVLYSLSVSTTLNQAIVLKPPLPEADRQQLPELFGHLLGGGLELPDRVQAKQQVRRMMHRRRYLLPVLAIVLSVGIITAFALHSIEEIHYLKSFYPQSFTVEQAMQASVVELVKVLLASLPLGIVIAVCVALLKSHSKRG